MNKNIKYNLSQEIRLDKFLKEQTSEFSRTKIQEYIKSGIVRVDDYNVKPSYLLKKGQNITFEVDNVVLKRNDLLPEKIKLDVIYEDDDIIVINKTSGIVVHPGIGNKNGTLLNGLLYHCSDLSNVNDRPGVIHRLDKETSGAIIFAKNDYAHFFISEQFASRKIKKEYLAFVWGRISDNIKINGYMNRDPKNRLKFKLFESKGKFSSSFIKSTLNYNFPISRVNICPQTGRTHQIRVHLSSIGHPIIKDDLYSGGDNKINSFHQKYKTDLNKIISLIDRVALHAYKIEFLHPKNNKKISINAPIPNDLCELQSYLDEN